MKNKTTFYIVILLSLAACTSQYRGRMVRVKTHKTEKLQKTAKESIVLRTVDDVISQDLTLDEEILPSALANELSANSNDDTDITPLETPTLHKKKKFKLKSSKLQDEDPEDIAFRKEQYRKANNYSYWSLGLLLSSFFTFFLGVIAAFITSLVAIRIYHKYKNPGVRENYILAMVVLVLSSLILFLSLALLIAFLTLVI